MIDGNFIKDLLLKKNKSVKAVSFNNNEYFILKEICDLLNLKNPTVTIQSLIPGDHFITIDSKECQVLDLGHFPNGLNLITTDGFIEIIAKSRKPEAKEIAKELNPSIRLSRNFKQTSFEFLLKDALFHIVSCYNQGSLSRTVIEKYVNFESEKYILNYRVDFYFKKLKLIVEYDERFHNRQSSKDSQRTNDIIRFLRKHEDEKIRGSWHLIRVKEGQELLGIIELTSYITHFLCKNIK